MALITCKECGGTVSDTAASCPHCGYLMKSPSVQTAKSEKSTEWIPVVAFFAIAIALIAIIAVIAITAQRKQTESFNKAVQEALTVEDGKQLEDYMKETEENIKDLAK